MNVNAVLIAVAFLLLPFPVDLETIFGHRAQHLDGRLVVATFLVRKPAYTFAGRTIIGTDDTPGWNRAYRDSEGQAVEREGRFTGNPRTDSSYDDSM